MPASHARPLWLRLVVLPLHLGEALLGPSLWYTADTLLPIVITSMIVGGFGVGAAAGVCAFGAARRSL